MKKPSKKWSLNWHDLLKGVLVSALTAFVATGGQMLTDWLADGSSFAFDHVSMTLSLKAAIAAGGGYLIKNFATDDK